ncbi:hypothetical protein D3C71_1616140 [compost metagenome]
MSQAVAFLLGKDQAFWQAQQAQLGALTARVQLETAKIQAASVQLEALNQKANFALTKMKVATEEVGYCSAKYNLEVMLPEQLLTVQKANATATYNLATMLPQQLLNLQGQQTLIKEQMEAQRGQTLDLRSDGATVMGVMGQQKLLYAQQITSYKRDAEVKAAKLFTDAWITQKTMDEGLLPPTGFTNASIDTILTALKLNNDLD